MTEAAEPKAESKAPAKIKPAGHKIGRLTPVGQILLEQGLIEPEELNEALRLQQETGDRLGKILSSFNYITTFRLHQAIADHYELPFVNLHNTPAKKNLADPRDLKSYIRHLVVPWQKKGEDVVLATPDPTPSLIAWAETRYQGKYAFVITSPFDIYWQLDTHFADDLDSHSRLHLWKTVPQQSARQVLSRTQKLQFFFFFVSAAMLWYFNPIESTIFLFIGINLFYLLTILLKCVLFLKGLRKQEDPTKHMDFMENKDLPVYTLLIPLHDESESIPGLLAALDKIDYPKAKLDIKLIVEREDKKTIDAIKAQRPHSGYEIIYVPYSLPQTKPKACNYALHFARGQYVTIYDAEDEPDPMQLKKAIWTFRHSSEDTICLQARLNYYNRNHSLLTRLFSIEYAAWFDFMLPGLRDYNIPIPLGGTSNHISLKHLREIGEWDPFNVTEDADLGIRLALSGYRTDLIDSLTAEEAPIKLGAWLSQRSRWIRGYMQTWLVHMRHPIKLFITLKPKAFMGFQLFVGGPCLVFLSAPILWAISLFWLLGYIPLGTHPLATLMTAISLFNLGFGLIAHMIFGIIVIKRYQWQGMALAMIAFPLYWLLHSVASFRALWQLLINPHFWEKTPHGLDIPDEEERQNAIQTMR